MRTRTQLGRVLFILIEVVAAVTTGAGAPTRATGIPSRIGDAPIVAPGLTAPPRLLGEADVVVDNLDPGFTTSGWWFIGDGGHSYAGNCAWAPRGIQNIAHIRPMLPSDGAYEVFAWWCGDPNHDQSYRTIIEVCPLADEAEPYSVQVDLQTDAGVWHSLGTYYLEPGAHVAVRGNLYGNVVADAFRFVYRSSNPVVIPPTPQPTPVTWTNHPPSPLNQVTSGDLSMRLGLVQLFYAHVPMIQQEAVTFDDCEAFPRDGCGGTRDGWQVVVQYQDMPVRYRVTGDYQLVVNEPSEELAARQTLFLHGTRDDRFLRVDRYPDSTWHLSGADYAGSWATHHQLNDEAIGSLLALVDTYNGVATQTPSRIDLRLFGLGRRAQMNATDADSLAQWVDRWATAAWPAPPVHTD